MILNEAPEVDSILEDARGSVQRDEGRRHADIELAGNTNVRALSSVAEGATR